MMNNKIGSQWRRWDLHFHTPASYDYKDKSITNEEIIKGLKKSGISAVAITDHHIIDVERIKELQSLGEKHDITVFPGIEFRSDLGGSECVHFIGVFSENIDVEELWTDIKSNCGLKPSQIAEVGDDNFYVTLKDTSELIHKLGGIVTIHAGKKSNTIENINNNHDYKMKIKRDLLLDYVDILEIGNPQVDLKGYTDIVFPSIGAELPLIICSDNHNIKDYKTKESLWIKGDLTFEGLRQIIYEPKERVRIQQENPACDFNKPYFTSIKVKKKVEIFGNGSIAFDKQEVVLNPNLVSIVGGRGEGKSILIDFFASAFGLSQNDDYEFSGDFVISYSKGACGKDFIEFVHEDDNNLEFLYISQNQVKDMALSHKKLGDEIKLLLGISSVGFSMKTQWLIDRIISRDRKYREWFKETNEEGVRVNDKEVIERYKKKYEDLLNSITSKENKEKIEKYTKNIKTIRSSESKKEKIEVLLSSLESKEIELNKWLFEISKSIPKVSFKEQTVELEKITKELSKLVAEKEKENIKIRNEFSKFYKGDLSTLLSNVDKYKSNIERLNDRIKEIERKQDRFKANQSKKKGVSSKIKEELDKQVKIIDDAWDKALEGNEDWTEDQIALMKKILSDREIQIKGSIVFNSESFYAGLKDCINGKYWRNKNKAGELESYFGINNWEDFLKYMSENLEKELENNEDLFYVDDLQAYFYDLDYRQDYLYVVPQITYKGKSLDRISVGQRGTVYLCLKLATSAFSTPIIYDQPEDDLDNQFIINELVDIFKDIKKYRQVIIVTHNANLVVNSDSEQVVLAKNVGEVLSYDSGALENPIIIEGVCNILEGGKTAFQQRRNRYKLN